MLGRHFRDEKKKITTHAATPTPQKIDERGPRIQQGSNEEKSKRYAGDQSTRPVGLPGPRSGEDGILKKSPSWAFLKARFPITQWSAWRCSSGVCHTKGLAHTPSPPIPRNRNTQHMSWAYSFRHIPVIDISGDHHNKNRQPVSDSEWGNLPGPLDSCLPLWHALRIPEREPTRNRLLDFLLLQPPRCLTRGSRAQALAGLCKASLGSKLSGAGSRGLGGTIRQAWCVRSWLLT